MNRDNNFLLRGIVASDPEKKELSKYELAEVIVQCPTSAKSKNATQEAFIPLTGWGDVADTILSCAKGDRIEAYGEIRSRQWENPAGKTLTFFSFVAEKVVKS